MFSDKTKYYQLAPTKSEFLTQFIDNEWVKRFHFGEVLFVKQHDNTVIAMDNKCPHQNLPLKGCKISGGNVVCPWHQYRFDLKTGRGHGLFLQTYELEENHEGYFLKRTYFSWFGE